MIKGIKDSTIAVRAVCAIVFCIFSFLYIYVYQTPTLAYEQHVLSGGSTYYHPLISAIVITVVAYLLQLGVYAWLKLRGASHSLTYLPSMLILTFLTAGRPDGNGGLEIGSWIWFVPIILIIYVIGVKIIQQWINASQPASTLLSSRILTVNLVTMVVMMLYVMNFGNGDEMFHREIKAEKLLIQQNYKALAHEGSTSTTTDSTLTLLRAIGLDKTGKIADSLFTQPVVGGVASLMHQKNVHSLLFKPRFMSRRKSVDYQLCALLAERDLDNFARKLSAITDVNRAEARDTLPKHYREALVLYQHLRSTPKTQYNDSILETDYRDLRQMLQNCKSQADRNNQLRINYATTYWKYYYTKAK